MSRPIVIKGGIVVDPSMNREGNFDVLLADGLVKEVGNPGAFALVKEARTVEASGCWVTPGLLDMHVHLREPGYEWKETVATGSKAAALGGFTSISCMANTNPVNDKAEITEYILNKAKQANLCRVLPIGAVSQKLEGKDLAPLSELRKAGCVAFSDDGNPIYDSLVMRRALEWSRMVDAPICCHEEDHELCHSGCMNEGALALRLGLRGKPRVGEDIMVARDIEMARAFKAKVHFCHLSSARSVELVRRAKNDGISVTAEVTPHHLILTEDAVRNYDANAKMSPPLRSVEDLEALLVGLKEGVIDVVASDHAPHEIDKKEIEFDKAAPGVIGLQSSLPLMLSFVRSGKLSRRQFVSVMSTNAAKILGLTDCGTLQPGKRADVTIIDPEKNYTFGPECVVSMSKNSPFFKLLMTGVARTVIFSGQVVVSDGGIVKE